MTRKHSMAFGLILGLTVNGAAAAHPETFQIDNLPNKSRSKSFGGSGVEEERRTAQGAHEMVRCLATKRTKTVRDFLSTTNFSQAKKIAGGLMREISCFSEMQAVNRLVDGRAVTFPPDVLRGMLAEHLIKNDTTIVRQLPALALRQQAYTRPWYTATGRNAVVDEMATCVAEVNPTGILVMLQTQPYSGSETATMGTLSPDFGRCLRAQAKLQANRQALRAALADALYQRTQPWPTLAVTGAAASAP